MDVKPSRLAVDTNVLLDVADEVDDVLDALSVIDERLPEAEQLAPPSVLEELAHLADFGQSRQIRQSAGRAINQLRTAERIRPILELPVGLAKIEALGEEFRRRGLLPEAEKHDALILAETVWLGCHVLLSSDEHLRSIDHELLSWMLNQHELAAPVIATPREIVRKFFR